eukprot:Colp12_sorted_trinity150504_noHs@31981
MYEAMSTKVKEDGEGRLTLHRQKSQQQALTKGVIDSFQSTEQRLSAEFRIELLVQTLRAMREDLAEWFTKLFSVDINGQNFFERIENGVLLCALVTCVDKDTRLPCRKNAAPGTFFARDNIAGFLNWCRK